MYEYVHPLNCQASYGFAPFISHSSGKTIHKQGHEQLILTGFVNGWL